MLSHEKNIKSKYFFLFPLFISKVRYKLLLGYVLLVFLPTIIGTYLSYFYTRKIIIDEAQNTLKVSVDNIFYFVKYKMEKHIRISNKMINDFELFDLLDTNKNYKKQGYNPDFVVWDIYTRKINPEIQNNYEEIKAIRIYKKNSSLPQYGDYILNEEDFKNKGWYKNTYNNKGVFYWENKLNSSGDKKSDTISIYNRIGISYDIGILEIEIFKNTIFDVLLNLANKRDTKIYICDDLNNNVFSSCSDSSILYQNLINNYIKNSASLKTSDLFLLGNIESVKYAIYIKQLNSQGWKIIAVTPLKTLYKTSDIIKRITLLTMFICIIIFLTITIFVSHYSTQRIERLAEAIKKVEKGNFEVCIEEKGNDEITQLCKGFNLMVKNINCLIHEIYKTKIEKKEAELRVLQEQINPHFLYNTLSTIKWFGLEANSSKIVNIVQALSDFYRISLSRGKEVIFLKDEFLQVKSYLDIQKIRYEDSFDANLFISNGLENIQVIKFIVQPFVENSIIHGFSDGRKGFINVEAKYYSDNEFVIEIEDNGKGMDEVKIKTILSEENFHDEKKDNQRGYGIKNVNQRIKLYYGEKYGVTIKSIKNKGTKVIIVLPIKKGEI